MCECSGFWRCPLLFPNVVYVINSNSVFFFVQFGGAMSYICDGSWIYFGSDENVDLQLFATEHNFVCCDFDCSIKRSFNYVKFRRVETRRSLALWARQQYPNDVTNSISHFFIILMESDLKMIYFHPRLENDISFQRGKQQPNSIHI